MNMWHLAFVGAETLDIPSAPPLLSHAAALNRETKSNVIHSYSC